MTSHLSPVTRHRKIALIGSHGMLAQAVCKVASSDTEIIPLARPDFDITNRSQVIQTLSDVRPDVIINCAAYTNVDGCESEEALASKVNGEGPGHLAGAAKAIDATLVHISTDYVFNGLKTSPYTEEDATEPQSAYGRSKLAGEQAIRDIGLVKYFIVRTSWLYGPGGKNFVETIARLAKERKELGIVADQVGSPTFTHDLANALFELLKLTRHSVPVTRHSPYGIYHFSNEGECSWCDFAEEIVRLARKEGEVLKVQRIRPLSTEEYPLPAQRPANSVFFKEKYRKATGMDVPDWREALGRYFRDRF